MAPRFADMRLHLAWVGESKHRKPLNQSTEVMCHAEDLPAWIQ